MKKILLLILLFQTSAFSQDLGKAYFAGGCFWCMEESFESAEGVSEVISGYSGGITEIRHMKRLHMEQQDILKLLRLSTIKIKQIIKIYLIFSGKT